MGFSSASFRGDGLLAPTDACGDGEEERSTRGERNKVRGGRKEVQKVRSYASNTSLLRLAATGNAKRGSNDREETAGRGRCDA